jgi:hypothetical protein
LSPFSARLWGKEWCESSRLGFGREFDHPLREKGVEGGETGLFST